MGIFYGPSTENVLLYYFFDAGIKIIQAYIKLPHVCIFLDEFDGLGIWQICRLL